MKRVFRIATAAAVVTLAATCSDGTVVGSSGGTTRILLTDSPFPFDLVRHVDVHVVRVDVSRTADTAGSADAQEWITVASPDHTFDLLSLQQGATAMLGEVDLPAAEYPALRMVIDASRSSITWSTGESATVNWQGPGEITLYAIVEGALEVPEAGGRIVIDFDVGRSFFSHGAPNPGFVFIPLIRAVNEATTGHITGTIDGPTIEGASVPIPGASVAVFRGDSGSSQATWRLVASAPVDEHGHYEVHYLATGSYMMRASAPTELALAPATAGPVSVVAGGSTAVDFRLQRDEGGSESAFLLIAGDTSLAIGQSATFFAAIFDEHGDSVFTNDVAWGSSDPGVASVALAAGRGGSQSATVTGLAEGSAVIIAVSGGLSDSLFVHVGDTVTTGGGPVATVVLMPESQTVAIGDSAYVQAILRDGDGRPLTDRVITWSVSRQGAIRIDWQYGNWLLFTGLAADTITVTATSEGKSGTAAVIVSQ